MGISALASQIALHTSIHGKLPTLYFSFRLSADQLMTRLVATVAKIDHVSLLRGNADDEELARCTSAEKVLRRAPLYIEDTPAISLKAIRRQVDKVDSAHSCQYGNSFGVIVVDDLQGIAPLYDPKTPEKTYRRVVSGLREIAQDYRAPVVLLSRLTRRLERRKDKRPRLSDLPSPIIPQLADHVLALHREEYYAPESAPPHQADLYVLRNRRINGFQVHGWPLTFLGSQLRFESRPNQRDVS